MFRAIALSLLLLTTGSATASAQGGEARTLIDDLMPAVWQRLQQGRSREAVAHSRRLLREDVDNALACATLIEAGAYTSDESPLDLGLRGLQTAGQLRHPRTMSEDEFLEMMKRVRLILNSAVGKAYMERKDPVAARRYLKEAVALAPGNAQNAYLAARAYLAGANPDPRTGYWLLARTVVLTQGTESGDRIAKYAWEQFWGAGGTEQGWKDYLAVASAGAPRVRSDQAVEVARARPIAPDLAKAHAAGGTSPAPSTSPPTQASVAPAQTASAPAQSASAPAPPTQDSVSRSTPPTPEGVPSSRAATQPAIPGPPTIASGRRDERSLPQSESTKPPELPTLAENVPPAFPSPATPRPNLSREAPISIGVLIEASVASKENRASVIYALSDMFRHLRENDEAFIVAYGRNVGIEQDLTWNYELLEKAMDRIDRKPGAALLEAVAFSSGHLARVARNPNRVLLVISDGTNEVGKVNPLEHAAEIRASGARIYCIGIGVPGSAERNRLQEIASRTGGGATFVEDPRAFRNAAHAIAESVGIDFPQ
jgi:hypothetical protein